MTVLGHDSTVPASMDEMIVLTRAVTRGARVRSSIADMPFGSFQVSDAEAVTQRDPVLQGGGRGCREARRRRLDRCRACSAIVGAGIPVMGHIGLTPQSATALGGFKAQGRTADQAAPARRRRARARGGGLLLRRARGGARTGRRGDHRAAVACPTIGIGAGAGTRRPGARLARPARPLPRRLAALREALRRPGHT